MERSQSVDPIGTLFNDPLGRILHQRLGYPDFGLILDGP